MTQFDVYINSSKTVGCLSLVCSEGSLTVYNLEKSSL